MKDQIIDFKFITMVTTDFIILATNHVDENTSLYIWNFGFMRRSFLYMYFILSCLCNDPY